jgi:hypothetical protein
MWILHKNNKAQCIYTSCVPARPFDNLDKVLAFYRMTAQFVKICELISGNKNGRGGMPGVIAARR